MSPDKTAIEKLWEKHSFDYHEPGVRDPVCVMIKDDFLAALSEAEGERERLQRENDKLCYYLGCAIPFVATCAHESATRKERDMAKGILEAVRGLIQPDALPAPPKEKP